SAYEIAARHVPLSAPVVAAALASPVEQPPVAHTRLYDDSSDEEYQPAQVIRDAINIADGQEAVDSSADEADSSLELPDVVQQAVTIADGHEPAVFAEDESLEAVREEMEQLAIRTSYETSELLPEQISIVLLHPDAKMPVRKHSDDAGLDVSAIKC
ncbi:hypothetical protein GGH14_005180, partial [Coemansia sp. RSA 370]